MVLPQRSAMIHEQEEGREEGGASGVQNRMVRWHCECGGGETQRGSERWRGLRWRKWGIEVEKRGMKRMRDGGIF